MGDAGSADGGTAVLEDIAYLVRSGTRVRLLHRLSTAPSDRRTLQDTLGVDRTTVQRNLDGLAERGWVVSRGGEWTLTLAEEAVLEAFEGMADVITLSKRLAPWLEALPASFDFELKHLADADLAVAGLGNPYTPINYHIAAIEAATERRLLLPSLSREALRVVLGRIENAEALSRGAVLGWRRRDAVGSRVRRSPPRGACQRGVPCL